MRKILPNDKKIQKWFELNTTPVYIVALWARWGVREFPFNGEFKQERNKTTGKMMYFPMVWMYNDHNGMSDQWELVDIRYTTTALIYDWTFYKTAAERLADKLNQDDNIRR